MIPFIQQRLQAQQEMASLNQQRTQLGGRTLIIVQTSWGLTVLFEVAILLMNFPSFVANLHTVCADKAGPDCKSLQLHAVQMAALVHNGLSVDNYVLYALSCDLVITALFLGIGALIFWHKSREPMGLFVSLLLITFGTFGMDEVHLTTHYSFIIELITILIIIVQWPALGLLFYLFPDGRFVPRWSWILMFLFVIQFVFNVLPYPYDINDWPPLLSNIEWLVVFGSAAGTQIYRYRAVASPTQRQQIKWFAFGFGILLLWNALFNLLPLLVPDLGRPDSLYQLIEPANLALTYLPIPVGIGIAILRYRLWDIDIIINRTLVYGSLTISVIVLYVLVVIGLGSAIQARGNLLLSLLATGLIAVLFQPSHKRLQQGVNRLMYGERDDPYRVLSRLGQRLEVTLTAEAVLPTIVETVA